MIEKVFLAATHELAKNTRNVETVKSAMKRIMKITNEMTHSLYVVDLLKELKRKGIGTNAIQHQIAKLCEKGEGREKILEIVMNYRIKAAHKEVRRLKYENNMIWRENDDVLIREGVLDGFLVIWAKEKTRYRQSTKLKQRQERMGCR